MFSTLFSTLIYNPLYNGLVFLLGTVPFVDVGIAVVILTAVVKLILYPLSRTAVRTQIALRALAPELEKIKKQNKDKAQVQAQKTMELYKEHGVNPFSGFLLILVQLPVIFGLYFIFLRGELPTINTDILYSFVNIPDVIEMQFLGILDLTAKSILVALLTGATQFVQISLATPKQTPKSKDDSFSATFAQSMQVQMKYVMPVIITVIAYTLPAIVGVYWVTSNIFTIGQELFVRRESAKK